MSTRIVERHIDGMTRDYRCTIWFCKIGFIVLIGVGLYFASIAIERQDWLKFVYEGLIVPGMYGLIKLHSWETKHYVDFTGKVNDAQRIANSQSAWTQLIRLSRIGR